jgi:hypothetical protein
MIKLRNTFYVLILALLCCKKPYNPPPITAKKSYLVVEGVINLSVDSTVIKISRTTQLNDSITYRPVLNATVGVEAEKYPIATQLADINNNGRYWTYDINIPSNQRYRLRIRTQEGEVYLSDWVEPKLTPPIDSIGYSIKDGILNLYVNAHDATNKTRLYKWDYEETWSFHSKYGSSFVLDPSIGQIVPRNSFNQIFICYANDVSTNIVLQSTEKLSKDVVYQGPLTQIPLNSEKIESEYSVLLKQYAINADAFNFFQSMKKNTEQLGSIFDAQPSQISGNIHNVKDPSEPIIGFVTVTNVQTKRVFIAHADLPGNVLPQYPYDCKEDTALLLNKNNFNDVQNILVNPPIDYIPTTAIYASGGGIIGYLYSTRECVDCTLRGSVVKPYYWPVP